MYRDQRSPFSSVPVICIGTSSVPFIQVFEESNNFSAIHMRSHLLCIGDTTHTRTHAHRHTATHTRAHTPAHTHPHAHAHRVILPPISAVASGMGFYVAELKI